MHEYPRDAETGTSERPVRIAIDGTFLRLPPSGIGTYVRCLVDALEEHRARLGLDIDVVRSRVRVPNARLNRFAWDSIGAGMAVARRRPRPQLLHLPQMTAPIVTPVPVVVTIHDVIPLVLPDYRASRAMQVYLALMARTARNAQAIITPSGTSAADIERVLGVARDRITVIPEAAAPELVPDDGSGATAKAVRRRFGLDGPYLFNIGGLDLRKNVPMLIDAFADALPMLPPDVSLVIAGGAHSGNTRIFPPVDPIIATRGLGTRVRLLGRVTDEERRWLYQAATACVTPSSYEGFGLTPLEAMACGTPVIASNASSFPEVIGNAGLLVEPSRDALAEAIVRLLGNVELRRRLAADGLERARQFSWARTAEETAAVYRSAVGS